MIGVPANNLYQRWLGLYQRWLGWNAAAGRRAVTALIIGLIVALALLPFVTWELALVAGWDVTALAFLLSVWLIIGRADSSRTARLATREDPTRASSATTLLVAASVASLLGVGYALILAGHHSGAVRVLLICDAVLTVMLSWTVINTVYTQRYASQHFLSNRGGIGFGNENEQERPSYRDFAYVAFTIGMTYQVPDTTLRDSRTRRTVLSHAILSYLFGVVIVAGSVNLISGLFP